MVFHAKHLLLSVIRDFPIGDWRFQKPVRVDILSQVEKSQAVGNLKDSPGEMLTGGDGCWVKWEADVKGGAHFFLAFDGYGPSVSGDDIFDNLGPKPGSSRFGAYGPVGK